MTAKKSGRVEESDSKTAEDEQFKSSKYSRKNRSNKCSKRPPIYIPRSEHNLLTNKGIQLIELIGQGSYSKVSIFWFIKYAKKANQLTYFLMSLWSEM